MKTFNKTITLPDGKTVTFHAVYRANVESVTPGIHGAMEELISLFRSNSSVAYLVHQLQQPQIEGVGFVGWLGKAFEIAGCTVLDAEDGGDWTIYRE
jgi:hypothetical protein